VNRTGKEERKKKRPRAGRACIFDNYSTVDLRADGLRTEGKRGKERGRTVEDGGDEGQEEDEEEEEAKAGARGRGGSGRGRGWGGGSR
jgi:hypothetical protein